MKALKIIGLIIAAIIVLFLIIGIFLPAKVHTEGSIVIKAPAKVIFHQVENFRNWQNWSPFERADTTVKSIYEGAEQGVGAIMRWTSVHSGNGSQTITNSKPYTEIRTQLKFEGQGNAISIYSFEEVPEGTKITWALEVDKLKYPFGRYMGLFMGSMMRPMFESGLKNLKDYCESNIVNLIPDISEVILTPHPALIIRDSAMVTEIEKKMGEMYGEIMGYMQQKKIEMAGPPFCVYYSWNVEKPFVMGAGIPLVKPMKPEENSNIKFYELPTGKAIKGIHKGKYDKSGITHDAMHQYMTEKKMEITGYPWEVYITDPSKEPDTSKWITEIYYPVK